MSSFLEMESPEIHSQMGGKGKLDFMQLGSLGGDYLEHHWMPLVYHKTFPRAGKKKLSRNGKRWLLVTVDVFRISNNVEITVTYNPVQSSPIKSSQIRQD